MSPLPYSFNQPLIPASQRFPARPGVRLEVDHRVPVVAGGTSRMDNLWALCLDCNRGKGTEEL